MGGCFKEAHLASVASLQSSVILLSVMAAAQVLRVPRSDSEGDFVLVNVSSNGSKPLDLKIEATEGESPYITTSVSLASLSHRLID